MPSIFANNYLNRKPVEKAMISFAKYFKTGQKVLDIGCGNKPYEKFFKCQYIGLDPFSETKADIIADAWDTPCQDNEFDGIILNQSLEHIAETQKTVSEIKRILRPGGLAILTVPQTMRNHSSPIPSEKIVLNNFDKKKIRYFNVDYYRFTKFGLLYLFKDFEVMELKETNGYFGTIFQLITYFFASLNIKYIFTPLYFVNNILGSFLDFTFGLLGKTNINIALKFDEIIYNALTLNYVLIIKKAAVNLPYDQKKK